MGGQERCPAVKPYVVRGRGSPCIADDHTLVARPKTIQPPQVPRTQAQNLESDPISLGMLVLCSSGWRGKVSAEAPLHSWCIMFTLG